ncbi:glycosyltransferase, partial [Burkholderia sp. SIMBA_042]
AYINALIDAGQTQAAWLALEMGQQRGLKGPAVNGLITRMAHDGGGYATSAVASVAAAPAPTVPAAAEADQETAAAKVAASDTRRPTPQEM